MKRFIFLLFLVSSLSCSADLIVIPPSQPTFKNILAGAVYDNGVTYGVPAYVFSVSTGVNYEIIITNDNNSVATTDFSWGWPANGVPFTGIDGVTNFPATTMLVWSADSSLAGKPVQEQIIVSSISTRVQKVVAIDGVISPNIQGTFNGDANINNLHVTNYVDARLTTGGIYPIRETGVRELPRIESVGSKLLPRLLSGTNPPVLLSMGDSMADDKGLFNGVAYYLEIQLRYMFGHAGKKMAWLDVFGPGNTGSPSRWSTNNLGMSVNNGSLIYGSDGTNSARSTATPNLFCNSGGFWAWKWTNAGTVYCTVTNNSGVPTTVSINLQVTNQLTNGLLFYTNFSFANGSNTVLYFTATSGSNYIIGADWYQTNGGGLIVASWNRGGYTMTNVVTGMGTNNTAALMAGIRPDIILVSSRNNGLESAVAVSNELWIAAMAATNVNTDCSMVLTYTPNAIGYGVTPNYVYVAMNLAATGAPFYALDLFDCFNNFGDRAIWGFDPHPSVLGGQIGGKLAYDMMGFNYNPGFPYSTTNGNDGFSIFSSASYSHTH